MEEKEIIKGKKNFSNVLKICILFSILGLILTIAVYTNVRFSSGNLVEAIFYSIPTFLFFLFLNIMIYNSLYKVDIIVTNKRVYGKTMFGKRVDLPLDSISAVGLSFLYGIDVGTSSGRIHFKNIENNNEVFSKISELLNARQKAKVKSFNSNIEDLKGYKELLDTGIITQEEFEIKKKELLK